MSGTIRTRVPTPEWYANYDEVFKKPEPERKPDEPPPQPEQPPKPKRGRK